MIIEAAQATVGGKRIFSRHWCGPLAQSFPLYEGSSYSSEPVVIVVKMMKNATKRQGEEKSQ